jgi:hypothetical protein
MLIAFAPSIECRLDEIPTPLGERVGSIMIVDIFGVTLP